MTVLLTWCQTVWVYVCVWCVCEAFMFSHTMSQYKEQTILTRNTDDDYVRVHSDRHVFSSSPFHLLQLILNCHKRKVWSLTNPPERRHIHIIARSSHWCSLGLSIQSCIHTPFVSLECVIFSGMYEIFSSSLSSSRTSLESVSEWQQARVREELDLWELGFK